MYILFENVVSYFVFKIVKLLLVLILKSKVITLNSTNNSMLETIFLTHKSNMLLLL